MYIYKKTRNIEALQNLIFDEYFKRCYYSFQKPCISSKINVDYYEINFRGKTCYILKFVNQNLRLIRIGSIMPDIGEIKK